ncbi:hypothetical protein THAOC_02342 [Thalassiosira oceanica]|uniref:Ubiquitin carboxyl-terminal hydrolase n=1 Tax=Thalassiosira oceanica TaxID=159749 RepID=K0TES8_THAOC|nr:hypothetical protein THAOC_02342 [Thalassiosira oceanica]|eukprot:EJK75920.1 hypothetical protein THAOC_02342 [Thalassiosira oceanica]
MVIGTSVWALVVWGIVQVCSALVRLVCGAILLPVKFVNIMRRSGFAAFGTNQGYAYMDYDHADHAAGDERPVLSVLALLVADIVTGVGFTSLIRNFLRPRPHLIERRRNEYAAIHHEQQDNVRESGVEVVENFQSHTDRRRSRDDIFIASIRGLRNRGQTCYANSVLQALASIEPLHTYLVQVQGTDTRGGISSALLETIRYVNGHPFSSRRQGTLLSRLPFISPSDEPQRVMNIIAKNHSQFRSRSRIGMAGTQEQQDSHEFITALLDCLSDEVKTSDQSLTPSNSNGLQSQDAVIDLTYEEEKKHEDTLSPTRSAEVPHNPFDGWTAEIRSEYIEDFLSSEYGDEERVSDVKCLNCAIQQALAELTDEQLLLDGAIVSINRRNTSSGEHVAVDLHGLEQESSQIRRKIAMLRAIDPNADEDKTEGADEDELGLEFRSLPRLVPLRGDALKASFVMRFPEALCLHIQRRHYDLARQQMVKIQRHTYFDETLDLYQSWALGQSHPASFATRISYQLVSVIEHVGNAFGGHYQTYRLTEPQRFTEAD